MILNPTGLLLKNWAKDKEKIRLNLYTNNTLKEYFNNEAKNEDRKTFTSNYKNKIKSQK